MSLWQEFKTFAVKGNVVDLAIGVIIGSSFSKVVSSLVADIAMPPLGILVGGVDFSGFNIVLRPGMNGQPPLTLNYGVFINTVIDFFIVAFVIFFVIKMMNRMHITSLLGTKECPYCLSPIPQRAMRCKFCTSQVK